MTSYLKSFLRARFSRESVLGLNLTLGVLLLSLSTWIFADLAEDIAAGDPLTITDARFSSWLHVHRIRSLTSFLLVVTNLHSTLGITIMTLLLCVYAWRSQLKHWISTILLTVYGGMILNFLLKGVFQRARPRFNDPILTLTSYSFPSGHTMMATVLYGVLGALIISQVRNWIWRALAVVSAVIMIVLVGFSRIYLGAHYLSDVLGAMAEGVAWLAVCLTGIDTWRRRRLRAKPSTPLRTS